MTRTLTFLIFLAPIHFSHPSKAGPTIHTETVLNNGSVHTFKCYDLGTKQVTSIEWVWRQSPWSWQEDPVTGQWRNDYPIIVVARWVETWALLACRW